MISLQQQVLKRRVKRDLIDLGHTNNGRLALARPQRPQPVPVSPTPPQRTPPSRTPHYGRVMHPLGHRPVLLETLSTDGSSAVAATLDQEATGRASNADDHTASGELGLTGSSSNMNLVSQTGSPFAHINSAIAVPGSGAFNRQGSQALVPVAPIIPGSSGTNTGTNTSNNSNNRGHFQFNDPSWNQMWYLVSSRHQHQPIWLVVFASRCGVHTFRIASHRHTRINITLRKIGTQSPVVCPNK